MPTKRFTQQPSAMAHTCDFPGSYSQIQTVCLSTPPNSVKPAMPLLRPPAPTTVEPESYGVVVAVAVLEYTLTLPAASVARA